MSSRDYGLLVARIVVGQACACGCGRPAGSLHHVVPKGAPWFGDDCDDNSVPLAGDGTRLCHGALETKQRTYDLDTGRYIEPANVETGIRRFLEEHREKLMYAIRKTSRTWVDARYHLLIAEL